MIPYIPHSPADTDAMLARIGVSSTDELFTDIPAEIRTEGTLDLPDSLAEADVMSEMERLAGMNRPKLLFAGAGMYDHIIPAVGSPPDRTIRVRDRIHPLSTGNQSGDTSGSL